MHPSLVPDCNNDGVTQSSRNPGKSYTNMCRWNGCHKFQRLDIDARLIFSGFREVGASHILKSWSYESPKQDYFRLKLMINKWRHTGASGNVTVYYFISEVPHFCWEGAGWGGGALAILCVLGMCRPQGYVFHNFCLGRVLFWGLINSLARRVFWSWFDTTRSFCK